MNRLNKQNSSAFYDGPTRYGGSSAIAVRRQAARKTFFGVKDIALTQPRPVPSTSSSNMAYSNNLIHSYTINSDDIVQKNSTGPQLTSSAKRIFQWIEANSTKNYTNELQITKRRRTKHRFNQIPYCSLNNNIKGQNSKQQQISLDSSFSGNRPPMLIVGNARQDFSSFGSRPQTTTTTTTTELPIKQQELQQQQEQQKQQEQQQQQRENDGEDQQLTINNSGNFGRPVTTESPIVQQNNLSGQEEHDGQSNQNNQSSGGQVLLPPFVPTQTGLGQQQQPKPVIGSPSRPNRPNRPVISSTTTTTESPISQQQQQQQQNEDDSSSNNNDNDNQSGNADSQQQEQQQNESDDDNNNNNNNQPTPIRAPGLGQNTNTSRPGSSITTTTTTNNNNNANNNGLNGNNANCYNYNYNRPSVTTSAPQTKELQQIVNGGHVEKLVSHDETTINDTVNLKQSRFSSAIHKGSPKGFVLPCLSRKTFAQAINLKPEVKTIKQPAYSDVEMDVEMDAVSAPVISVPVCTPLPITTPIIPQPTIPMFQPLTTTTMVPPSFPPTMIPQLVMPQPVTGSSLPNGTNPFQPISTATRGRKVLRPTRRLHR